MTSRQHSDVIVIWSKVLPMEKPSCVPSVSGILHSIIYPLIQSFNHSIIQTEWPENTLKRTTIVSFLTHSVCVYIVATSEKLSTINNDTHGSMMHILPSYWVSGVQLITILTIYLCLYHQPVIGDIVCMRLFSKLVLDMLFQRHHNG